jgi:thioredoxin
MMLEVTDATFEDEVLGSPRPIVVDFWAPWCGPCESVAAIFEQLAQSQAGRIDFARVNVDENPIAASRYDVLSLPTAILFDAGEPRDTILGARSREHYERAWARWLQ